LNPSVNTTLFHILLKRRQIGDSARLTGNIFQPFIYKIEHPAEVFVVPLMGAKQALSERFGQ
jgi:hypothetical protein